MRKLIMILASVILLTSCGSQEDANGAPIKNVTVVEETLVCSQATPNTCSSENMVCHRENYYSNNWSCTVILNREEA